MTDSTIEFPVNVSRSDGDDYSARLVDLPDGPEGRGVDPYAALDDLAEKAQSALAKLQRDGALPSGSPIEDRPVINFDPVASNSPSDTKNTLAVGQDGPIEMIGYSWTNHIIFQDK